nr:MAG TPA: hypothetical protein [Caudoviricetes sp.]
MKQFNRGEITVFVISMKQKCYIYRTFIGQQTIKLTGITRLYSAL